MNEKQIGLFDEADRKLAERFRVEKPNPVDTAKDMKKAMDEYGLTQEELAARIGKSRSAVANMLRLLTLCGKFALDVFVYAIGCLYHKSFKNTA